MLAVRDFLTQLHIGNASGWDIFILLIFLTAILVYGFFLGRNRIVILLLASYFSWVILLTMPWSRIHSIGWLNITESPSSSLQIIIFVGLIILLYFLIPRSAISSPLRIRKRGDASWWQLLLLGSVQVGFLIMVILSFLSSKELSNLGPAIKKIFIGQEAQFVWVILPLLFLVLLKRRRKDKDKK